MWLFLNFIDAVEKDNEILKAVTRHFKTRYESKKACSAAYQALISYIRSTDKILYPGQKTKPRI